MRIHRNKNLERQIMDRGREFLESRERAEGIHASSLLQPRLHYFRTLKPMPLSDKEVGFFIAGRAHHEVILAVMKKAKEIGEKADEGSSEWKGIHYSPDYRLGFLAEIKSSRRQHAPPDNDEEALKEEYDNYLNQLAQYMAVEQQHRASLIIFYISMRHDDANKTTYPEIHCYDVTMTASELDTVRREMLAKKALLEKALKTKKHTILPLCPAWMCTRGGIKGPVIQECKYYNDCKPEGRYPLELVRDNLRKKKEDLND